MQDIDELAPKWLSSKTIQLYNKRIVNIYSHILCSQGNMYFAVNDHNLFCNNQLFYLNRILVTYNLNVVHTNGKNSLLTCFLSGLRRLLYYNGYPLKGHN